MKIYVKLSDVINSEINLDYLKTKYKADEKINIVPYCSIEDLFHIYHLVDDKTKYFKYLIDIKEEKGFEINYIYFIGLFKSCEYFRSNKFIKMYINKYKYDYNKIYCLFINTIDVFKSDLILKTFLKKSNKKDLEKVVKEIYYDVI